MHKLLVSQLAKLGIDLSKDDPVNAKDFAEFVESIDREYTAADRDRYLFERSLKMTSKEMSERWQTINLLLKRNEVFLDSLEMNKQLLIDITKGSSLLEIADRVCKYAMKSLSANASSVGFVKEEGGELSLFHQNSLPSNFNQIGDVPIADNSYTCGTAAFHKKLVLTGDIKTDDSWKDAQNFTKQSGLKSCVSCPILGTNEALIGTLAVFIDGDDEISSFTEAQERIINNLSQMMSVAYERDKAQKSIEKQQAEAILSSKKIVLGEMAGGIAHEINNPLTIIMSTAELIPMRIKAGTFDGDEVSDKLMKTVLRIKGIIDALRIYSRERDEDQSVVFCLNDAIVDALALCSEKNRSAGVKLLYDRDEAKNTQVLGNQIHTTQIIVNLISNAFDAINDTKDAWISVDFIDSKLDNTKVEVKVTDSGLGIKEDIRDKILQPFFTTKIVGKGTGIGLSISHKLAQSNGGDLWYNEKNPNTQFILSLKKGDH